MNNPSTVRNWWVNEKSIVIVEHWLEMVSQCKNLDATAQISQVLPNICGKCWLLVVGNAQMHRWGAEGSLINLIISRFAQAMDGQLAHYTTGENQKFWNGANLSLACSNLTNIFQTGRNHQLEKQTYVFYFFSIAGWLLSPPMPDVYCL